MVEMNPSVEYAPLEAALREASNGLLQKLKIDFPEASMKMGAWANPSLAFWFCASLQRGACPGGDEDAVVCFDVKREAGRLLVSCYLAGPEGESWAEHPEVTVDHIDDETRIPSWLGSILSFIESLAPTLCEEWTR